MKSISAALALLLASHAAAQFDSSRILKGKVHEKSAAQFDGSRMLKKGKASKKGPAATFGDADQQLGDWENIDALSMPLSMSVADVPANSMSMISEPEYGEWGALDDDDVLMSVEYIAMASLSMSMGPEDPVTPSPPTESKAGKAPMPLEEPASDEVEAKDDKGTLTGSQLLSSSGSAFVVGSSLLLSVVGALML